MWRRETAIALGLSLAITGNFGVAEASELVAYKIVDQVKIPAPLTSEAGDPVRGRAVAIDRKKGNCLACHDMPVPEQPFHGEIGPNLADVATRLSEGELRLRVVNSKKINPESSMPAFYRTDGLNAVSKDFVGEPILTAQEVEDVVAYLMTLKGQ